MIQRGFGFLAVAVAGVAGCGLAPRAQKDFALTASWADYQRVVVRTTQGSIRVTADSEAGQVVVSGRKFARGLTLAAARENVERVVVEVGPDEGDPQTLRIEVRAPDRLSFWGYGASLEVRVPRPCAIDARTGNGSIRCEGVGRANLRTTNGAVRVHSGVGPLRVTTRNGAVVVEDVAGDCVVRTLNGRVEARGVRGSLDVETFNGRIEAEPVPPDDGHVTLRTTNGRVVVTLPGTLHCVLRVGTSNGRIRLDRGPARVSDLRTTDSSLRGVLNGGGPADVRIRTTNGSVTVRFR